MIRLILLLISFLICQNCFSQAKSEKDKLIRYYKNEWFSKEVRSSKFQRTTFFNINNEEVTIDINTNSKDTLNIQYLKEGKPVGIWKSYNKYEKQYIITDFTQLKYATKKEKESDIYKYSFDIGPLYNSADSIPFNFIANNTRYPGYAKDAGVSGTVIIRFKVNKKGVPSFTHIIKGVDPFLDAEAVRVINLLEKWDKPGYLNGEPIDVYFEFPLRFKLL